MNRVRLYFVCLGLNILYFMHVFNLYEKKKYKKIVKMFGQQQKYESIYSN